MKWTRLVAIPLAFAALVSFGLLTARGGGTPVLKVYKGFEADSSGGLDRKSVV